MDYKEKYEKAIERMKSWARGEHPECFTEAQKAAEFIFPELKESEDERIRKEILDYIDKATGCKRWIAWLEKQGEPQQKQEWSDEDKRMLKEIVSVLEGNNVRTTKMLCEYANWLKSLKPQPHWKPTEEQIEAVKRAAKDVFEFSSKNKDLRLKNETYFKSLYSLYEQLEKL